MIFTYSVYKPVILIYIYLLIISIIPIYFEIENGNLNCIENVFTVDYVTLNREKIYELNELLKDWQ